MKVTMERIAELAGVSVATVSRSLNGSDAVSAKTRERVLEICEKFGYNINAAASSLRRQTAGAFGLVIPYAGMVPQGFSNPFLLEMIGHITSEAASVGFDVIVSLSSELGRLSKLRLLSAGKVDALIIIGQGHEHESLNQFAEDDVPFIVWGDRLERQVYPTIGGPNLERQRYPTIGGDNLEGGRAATAHLLQRGCRKILFVGEFRLPEVHLRYHGHCLAQKHAGLNVVDSLCADIAFSTVQEAQMALMERLADEPDIDGVCAASDLLGSAAIKALSILGRHVPNDVAVTGYDDIFIAELSSPSLTSIHQDLVIGSQKLVEAAVELAKGGVAESFIVPTYLVERESA